MTFCCNSGSAAAERMLSPWPGAAERSGPRLPVVLREHQILEEVGGQLVTVSEPGLAIYGGGVLAGGALTASGRLSDVFVAVAEPGDDFVDLHLASRLQYSLDSPGDHIGIDHGMMVPVISSRNWST